MKDDVASKTLAGSAEGIRIGMNSVAVLNIVINYFVSASLMHLFDMMNALQIMCFMTMINQRFPANAQVFVQTVISILNVDILSPDLINDRLFNFQYDETLMESLSNDFNST